MENIVDLFKIIFEFIEEGSIAMLGIIVEFILQIILSERSEINS